MAKGEVRGRMVVGAVRLLAENGLEGTSFAEVLAIAGAPRGSTYHHFPGGKRELVDAAVDLAGEHAKTSMEPMRGQPAPAVVAAFFTLWRHLLTASELRAGCAVLAVAVDAEDDAMRAHTGAVFRGWREHLTSLLVDGGLVESDAQRLAASTIAASEGAVALARAEQDMTPFDLVQSEMVERAVALRNRPSPD